MWGKMKSHSGIVSLMGFDCTRKESELFLFISFLCLCRGFVLSAISNVILFRTNSVYANWGPLVLGQGLGLDL